VHVVGHADGTDGVSVAGPPTPEQAEELAAACRDLQIELVGAPLS
jgi:hypothetical protein